MKYLTYFLFNNVGFNISSWIFKNGGEVSILSILTGFWTGYFGHMILTWGDKK